MAAAEHEIRDSFPTWMALSLSTWVRMPPTISELLNATRLVNER